MTFNAAFTLLFLDIISVQQTGRRKNIDMTEPHVRRCERLENESRRKTTSFSSYSIVLVRHDAHESLRGSRLDSVVLFADGVVAFKVADVVAVSGHLHCVDRSLGGEPGYVAAGSVGAASGGDAGGDQACVLAGVVVERGTAPVGARL